MAELKWEDNGIKIELLTGYEHTFLFGTFNLVDIFRPPILYESVTVKILIF